MTGAASPPEARSIPAWVRLSGVAIVLLGGLALVAILRGVRFTYTLRVVSSGGALLGLVSGALGCFAVLRGESLLGDALSHAALPGVAIAFLLAGRQLWVLLLGAAIASLVGVAFIRLIVSRTRIKPDGAMGVVLAGWFAVGIALLVFIQSTPDASQAGLDSFIFGQAAAIVRSDVILLLILGTGALLLVILMWKEFKLITFDPEFAGANGYPVRLISGVLSLLVVLAIVLGLQLAGVILMAGLLVAPGVAARQWTDNLGEMVGLSAVFGAVAGASGAMISALDADIPTGPMIIVVAVGIVAVSLALAPERGLFWAARRRSRDRERFRRIAVLRDCYHYAFDHAGPSQGVPEGFLFGVRGAREAVRALNQLRSAGLLERRGEEWVLTDLGWRAAAADAQRQRLWDAYVDAFDRLDLPTLEVNREIDPGDLLSQSELGRLQAEVGDMQGVPRVRD